MRNLDNSTKTYIIKAFLGAISLSLFIYLDFLGFENRAINTFFGLIGLYVALIVDKKGLFWYGFFVGLLWFWWISISFIYYELQYLIPFIVLFFAVLYGVLFFVTSYLDKFNLRFVGIFLLSFFEPMGFNWFKPEIVFVSSYLNANKITLFVVLAFFASFIYIKNHKINPKFLLVFLIPFLLLADVKKSEVTLPNIKIKLVTMDTPQDLKWHREYQSTLIGQNLREIETAINEGYEAVVLPEATFALALNVKEPLMDRLKELSYKIDIVTGGIYFDGTHHNNSTYFFSKGEVQIANKMVLVPFGEATPLPKFMVDWINDTFYGGAEDFVPAEQPTDFEIKGVKFRNAICYEATSKEIYEDNPKYVIATSNNAWFLPSIEPNLQKLLMKYYAKKHHTVIYSVANGSPSLVIKP